MLRVNFIDSKVHILEKITVFASDLLFCGRRDVYRDTFIHKTEIWEEQFKILKLIGGEDDVSARGFDVWNFSSSNFMISLLCRVNQYISNLLSCFAGQRDRIRVALKRRAIPLPQFGRCFISRLQKIK